MEISHNYLKLLSQKDYKVFTDFFNSYASKIAFWIYLIVGRKEDAEDLAMDIIVSVPDMVQGKKGLHKCFDSWLFTVAKNKALNFIKHNNSIRFVQFDENLLDSRYLFDEEYNPILGKSEFHFYELKNVLTEQEYKILFYKYYQNMKRKEIADLMKLTDRQVKRKVESAFTKLKEYFRFMESENNEKEENREVVPS